MSDVIKGKLKEQEDAEDEKYKYFDDFKKTRSYEDLNDAIEDRYQ